MSAIPPLSGDKQTFGEQAEKTAHDPNPTWLLASLTAASQPPYFP